MAINITTTGTIPAVSLDKLHIDQLLVRVDKTTLKKQINGTGTPYGLDGTNRVFANTNLTIDDNDFDSSVVAWAIANGQATDPADALTKLNAAKAQVTASNPDVFTLLAHFEQGVGKIFEVAGDVTVQGIS